VVPLDCAFFWCDKQVVIHDRLVDIGRIIRHAKNAGVARVKYIIIDLAEILASLNSNSFTTDEDVVMNLVTVCLILIAISMTARWISSGQTLWSLVFQAGTGIDK
jgi:hypothetical protein